MKCPLIHTMMFKKYVLKLTNTIGTVDYLRKKSSATADLVRKHRKKDKYSKGDQEVLELDMEADYMPRSRYPSACSTDSAITSGSSRSGSASSLSDSDSDSSATVAAGGSSEGGIVLNRNCDNVLVFDPALLMTLPAAQIIISTAIAELRSAPELQPLVYVYVF